MPRKRRRSEEDFSRAYFYLDRIPNVSDSEAEDLDDLWDNATNCKEDLEVLLTTGIGRLLIWCNVVGLPIANVYRCPFGTPTSVALDVARVPEEVAKIERDLVGDHENWDKKGACTTLLRMKFRLESELLAAGKY